MAAPKKIEKPDQLELSQYLLVDISLLLTLGYLLLTLIIDLAVFTFLPDWWWLSSWTP